MYHSLKKKNSLEIIIRESKHHHKTLHSPNCPKSKQYLGPDKELFVISPPPPPALGGISRKPPCHKKHKHHTTKVKEDDLYRKSKKREPHVHKHKIGNTWNNYFSLDDDHSKTAIELRKIHEESQRIKQQADEILERDPSEFKFKQYLYNLLDRFKTTRTPKPIDVVYTRIPKRTVQESITPIRNHEHRHKQIEDMYHDTVRKDVLFKNNKDVLNNNHVKRCKADDLQQRLEKEHKHHRNHQHFEEHISGDKLKKSILPDIRSETLKTNSFADNSRKLEKIPKFDDEQKLTPELDLMQLSIMKKPKCTDSISVAVSAKSLHRIDAACQASDRHVKILTEINQPVIEIIHDKEPHQQNNTTNLRITNNANGAGIKAVKTECEIIENVDLETASTAGNSSVVEPLKTHTLPNKSRQKSAGLSSTCITDTSDDLPTKKTTLLLTKTYRQPEKMNLLERSKQYSESLRQKLLKQQNQPPQVMDVRYLTDLATKFGLKEEQLTTDWLAMNQKCFGGIFEKETAANLEEKQETKRDIEIENVTEENQPITEHKLKVKENTFNINLKNHTKIHICSKKNPKVKRVHVKKYHKANCKFSRKNSEILTEETKLEDKKLQNCRKCSKMFKVEQKSQSVGTDDEGTLTNNQTPNILENEWNDTDSLDEILRKNSDFLKKDFSYITEPLTTVKVTTNDKIVVDFPSVVDSKNTGYVTLKSIEDICSQTNLKSLLKPTENLNLKLLEQCEEKSLKRLDSLSIEDVPKLLNSKTVKFEEVLYCDGNVEYNLAKSEINLGQPKNKRSEVSTSVWNFLKIKKWKLSKSLSCIHKANDT